MILIRLYPDLRSSLVNIFALRTRSRSCYTFKVTPTILTVGAALHLRIPPALKTGPRLTALLPAYHLYLLGQRTPRLSTGPKEAERQHQLVANRASIAVTIQAHKSMLEQATNTNQNNKEGNKNKKHKKGNKDSNKSWRYSDSIMKDGKEKKERGENHEFICSSLGKQRKRPG